MAIAETLKDILCKMEECRFLLRDGKHVLAYQKLIGVQQKTAFLYEEELKSENNSDKEVQ